MIVKTKRAHTNRLGSKPQKKVGDVYDAGPDASALIAAGLAEEHKEPAKAAAK